MLSPKKTKFRKQHKGRIHGYAKGGTSLSFGAYGLKALQPERVTARQIEAARRAMTRHVKRQGKIWIRIFPDVPVSKSRLRYVRVKGKAPLNIGPAVSSRAGSCSRWTVFRKNWPARHCHWPRQSCRSEQNL